MHSLRKCPELVNNWTLHQENAPLHKAFYVTELLEENNIEVMEHPPVQSRSCPCDFWLFLTLKKALKGQQFFSGWKLLTATKPSLLVCWKWQNACRNAFWVNVVILRESEAKMKMLVAIANKIFYHIFLWKLWQGSTIWT